MRVLQNAEATSPHGGGGEGGGPVEAQDSFHSSTASTTPPAHSQSSVESSSAGPAAQDLSSLEWPHVPERPHDPPTATHGHPEPAAAHAYQHEQRRHGQEPRDVLVPERPSEFKHQVRLRFTTARRRTRATCPAAQHTHHHRLTLPLTYPSLPLVRTTPAAPLSCCAVPDIRRVCTRILWHEGAATVTTRHRVRPSHLRSPVLPPTYAITPTSLSDRRYPVTIMSIDEEKGEVHLTILNSLRESNSPIIVVDRDSEAICNIGTHLRSARRRRRPTRGAGGGGGGAASQEDERAGDGSPDGSPNAAFPCSTEMRNEWEECTRGGFGLARVEEASWE